MKAVNLAVSLWPARTGLRILLSLGVLALATLATFNGVIDRLSGHSERNAVAEAEGELSEAARALVHRCFEGLDPELLVDHHAHVGGVGNGSDCWVNPRMRRWWHMKDYLRFRFYRSAAGMGADDDDWVFLAELAALAEAEPHVPKPVLLAFDHRYGEDGEKDLDHSEFYVPNDHTLEGVSRHPERFVAAGSVHPYRKDAVEELERLHAAGVRIIKWLPSAQGIDPSSDKCTDYYAACKRLEMTLLIHVGEEQAVEAESDQALGNPLLLRYPLRAGVRVMAAHCASLGTDKDLDTEEQAEVECLDLFLRLMDEPEWEGLLFGEISTLTQRNRFAGALAKVLDRQDLHPRLVNGSDWPLPAVNVLYSTKALMEAGFLTEEENELLRELYHWNPLLFDFCLKRTVKSPETGNGFADVVFHAKFPVSGDAKN